MLTERERHTLHGLYALEPGTYYTAALLGQTTPHLEIRRGCHVQHVRSADMQRLDLDILSAGRISARGCVTALRTYTADATLRGQLSADVYASAARHPALHGPLSALQGRLARAPGQRLTIASPDLLEPSSAQLLTRLHALPSGLFTLHLQRTGPAQFATTYTISDARGTMYPLTFQALSDLMIIQPGQDLMILSRPDGRLESSPPSHYHANPAAHQSGVTAWALRHPAYQPLREELLSRGARSPQETPGLYELGVPLAVP